MKLRLVLAIALVTVGAADAGAQFGRRLPAGSYSRSCSDAAMIGSVLTAQCKDQNGETIQTRLYVRDCASDIGNALGELTCSARRLPEGSYIRSCNDCVATGSALQCRCQDTKQNPIRTSLDLSSCQWGGGITNKDGHLQCD